MDFVVAQVNQTQSRLSSCVFVKDNVTGSTCRFNKMDDSDMYSGSRHGDTILADDAHSYVDATLLDWHKALLVDELDKLKTLVSLENVYTQNILAACQRRKDRTIILEGLSKSAGTYSVTGATNGGLEYSTVVKVAGLAEDLEWPEEDRYFGWTGAGLATLLEDAQLTSKDYSAVQAIQNGKMGPEEKWMGFRWVKINGPALLAAGKRTGAVGSVTAETTYAWNKFAVGLAIGQNAKVRIAERPDKNHATQVYGCLSMGGALVDNDRIIDVVLDY
jgi:hypothetical protein